MMVFSTRGCARPAPKQWSLAAWLALLLVFFLGTARADTAGMNIGDMRLEREDDGLYLTATVNIRLNAAMEEVLQKGIPLYFIAQADVMRDRWYWSDARVGGATRHLRLTYQPLTRRWRVNSSATPIAASGLGVNLAQYYDSMADALSAMGRLSHWQLASKDDLADGGRQRVAFKFWLDTAQLPRLFQIDGAGPSDWTLQASHTMRLTSEAQP